MPIMLSSARATARRGQNFESFPPAWDLSQAEGPVTLTDYLKRIQDYGARQHFARNETIFTEGEKADQVYRILSGTVRLCRNLPDGRRSVLDFLVAGDLMGFVESATQPISAEAVSEVTLIAFPRICFERLARENEQVRVKLLCHLSETLLNAQQHLFVLGCQKAKERVASFLVRLAERLDLISGERMDLAMSRQDIADHLGLTIETVSRMITQLRTDGLLGVPNSHQLILRDTNALKALAAEG